MVWTFILIIFLIVTGIAVAGEQVLHSKIKSIEPHKVDGQYCYVKVEIIQEGDTITKREILEPFGLPVLMQAQDCTACPIHNSWER